MKNKEECIFCDFVSGKWKKHRNKFVFEILHQTPRTMSFHSIDFPSPKLIKSDDKERIEMEFIKGPKVRDIF